MFFFDFKRAFFYIFQLKSISKYFLLFVLLSGFLLPAANSVKASGAGKIDASFGSGGKVFTTFGNLFADWRNDIAVQTDGKIVMVGSGIAPNMIAGAFCVARYNADGSLDSTFGTGGKVVTDIDPNNPEITNSVIIQPDGKILLAGQAKRENGGFWDSDIILVRYNQNGSLDASFGTGGISTTSTPGNNYFLVNDVVLMPDGRIVVAGNLPYYSFVARYNANGSPDTSFDTDGLATYGTGFTPIYIESLAIQPDGKIILSGQWSDHWTLFRYNTNGSLDTNFGSGGRLTTGIGDVTSRAHDILIQPDGKILAAGYADASNPVVLMRYNPNGTFDATFDNDGILTHHAPGLRSGRDVELQPDGKIVVLNSHFNSEFVVSRYLTDGAPDIDFGANGTIITPVANLEITDAVSIQPDGRIVVTGTCSDGSFVVARYTVRNSPQFDFDGDGKTDIGIYRPSLGEWWLSRSSDGIYATTFGTSTDKITPGDYTGDGKADIGIWRAGEWFVLRSEDGSYFSHPFGTTGDIPAPADFDGDGKTDEAVFRPSTATWYILRSSGGITIQQFGQNGDVPVVADYDGDGKADIGIYRVSLGEWWYQGSASVNGRAFQFGSSTDKPVPGDYTGDGKADVAIWRPSTGEWFVLRSENNNSFYSFPFGASGDVPAPGDYDGDGAADAAVFRPSGATWYVRQSTSGILIQNFGQNGDRPIPNAFVP